MMDIANVQDSRMAGVLLEPFESPVAFAPFWQMNDGFAPEPIPLTRETRNDCPFDGIIGKSEALRRVLEQVERVAPLDSTVLIYGETGTGKELIARAVHNLSPRRSRAFVKFNCAAIPTGLLESELFGHEKGAFTGAITQRLGRFELAHGGTIFLDEIGEIPMEMQPKLLRVLQEREFERLGGTRTIQANARLIAATNRNLKSMVEEREFRSDLYYRLHVFPVRVPALRERPEDIPLLVCHFVREFGRRNGRAIESICPQSMKALVGYHWPGNIRELQNVIERSVILSKNSMLTVELSDLDGNIDTNHGAKCSLRDGLDDLLQGAERANHGAECSRRKGLDDLLQEAERAQILHALEAAKGVVAGPKGAAAHLKIKRSTLMSRMQRLGIQASRNFIVSDSVELN